MGGNMDDKVWVLEGNLEDFGLMGNRVDLEAREVEIRGMYFLIYFWRNMVDYEIFD